MRARFTPKSYMDFKCGPKFTVTADLAEGTKAIYNPTDDLIQISPSMARFLFSPDTRERSLMRKSLRVIDLADARTFCNY